MSFLPIVWLILAWITKTSADSLEGCPAGWESWSGQCYIFVFFPVRDYNQAFTACQMESAYLLSVNTKEEYYFVSQWLTNHDMKRDDRWWTSGKGEAESVRWDGDGTTATFESTAMWTNDIDLHRQSNLPVVFAFATQTDSFTWSRQQPSVLSPYVCEISQAQAFMVRQASRDFTFGTDAVEASLVPRGPRFSVEPESVVVVGNMDTAWLECVVDSTPPAQYRWYKETMAGPAEISTATDARYSITNGRFSFQQPDQSRDAGRYHCLASNPLGTIISHSVTVSFGFLGEFSNDPPGSVRALQSQGTYIECRPPRYQPGLDYQWYRSPGSQFLRPSLNKHIFISFNGRLYFSETQLSDAGFYHCLVTLVAPPTQKVAIGQAPSRASLGVELVVAGDMATEYGPTIHNDFPAIFPSPALRGLTLRLECFAYGRLPLYYTWRRENGPVPSGAFLSEEGRVLNLPNVQMDDSGNYTCHVERGSSAFDEKSIALLVQAVPFFSFPPRDQHVDVGSTFTLVCQAVAVPSPTYAWYRNGQPLTSDPGNIEVVGNVVTFFNADPARHDGMYECSASSIHGTRMSQAQVRVLEFQPSFRKTPLRGSQTATVGGNVTFLCQPEAAPAPSFDWAHNDQPLGLTPGLQGRVMLLSNGNLFISPVQLSDVGKYTCTATNSKGSDSSSGFLAVVMQATLTIVPANTEVMTNDTAFLACQASYDPRHTDLIVVWRFNGFPVNTDHDAHYRQVQQEAQSGLYIVNAQFRHDGVYECVAQTVDNSVTASAYLTVKGPPREPAGVSGHNDGNDVILYWTESASRGSPIIYYVIEFSSNFRPEWQVKESELRQAVAADSQQTARLTYRATGLSPGSSYSFRVRAVNGLGISNPSLPSEFFRVNDAAPMVAPAMIRNKVSTVGTLSFEWDPLKPEDLTGSERGYRLYWRKKDDNTLSQSLWQTATVDSETTSHVAFVGVENYYLEYEVMVAAFNSLGQGPNSTITIVMSQEDLPLATPRKIWGEDLNCSALLVYWDPIDTSREIMRGKLVGVQILFWAWYTNKTRWSRMYCPEDPSECVAGVVIGLHAAGNFWVKVQVFNSAGLGPLGEVAHITTFLEAPLQYPEYVAVYSIQGNRVHVQWRGIIIGGSEEALKGYKLWWWPATENMMTANVTVLRGRKRTWAVLEGVKEGTLYALRVLGYSRGGDGKKSPTVYFTLEGQVMYNPETTEILASGNNDRASLWLTFILYTLHRNIAAV